MNSLLMDPALRSLPRWLLKGAMVSMVSLQILLFVQALLARSDSDVTVFVHPALALAIWFAPAIFLVTPGVRKRCSDISMGLPVTARKLWLTHLTALVLSGTIILFVMGWILEFHRLLLARIFAPAAPAVLDDVALLIHLFSGVVLAIVLLQTPERSLQRISGTRGNILRTLLVLVGTLAIVVLLGRLPIYFAILPIAAAWIIGARAYRSVPEAFLLLSGSIEEPADTTSTTYRLQEDNPRGFHFHLLQIWTILRCYPTKDIGIYYAMVVAYPALLGSGVLLSGLWSSFEDMRYTWLALTAYILFILVPAMATRLHLLDSLPISRRTIFATLVLPCLLSMGFGYGLGVVWQSLREPELISYKVEDPYYYVQVPTRYMEIARDGQVPQIDSPWGESHPAWSGTLWKGDSAVVYSPFSVTGESSAEFEALMVSRAAKAVHGVDIPHTEILSRYFSTDESGKLKLSQGELTLRRDYGSRGDRMPLPLFPVVFPAVILLWALAASLYYQTFRAGVSSGLRKTVFFVIAGFLLLLHLGPFPVFATNITEPWKIGAGLEIGLRETVAALPGGPLLIWLLGALVLAGAYRLAEWRFEKTEIPIENS
jgi:hypothetical protein